MREVTLTVDGTRVSLQLPRAVDLECRGFLSGFGVEYRPTRPAFGKRKDAVGGFSLVSAVKSGINPPVCAVDRLERERRDVVSAESCARLPVFSLGVSRTLTRSSEMPPQPIPAVERFWTKVEKTDTCWVWTSAIYGHGYGQFNIGNRRTEPAHRFSYKLHHGPIPAGMLVMHSCDNRRCVNPAHLSLGTHRDNTHDAITKGRLRVGEFQLAKTHCVHGHPFDAENTIVAQRAGRGPERSCRACRREISTRYRLRKRMAVAS